ncbi:hypothetical protein LX36DRAFT_256017 [Colletotrichum falcatum]|nr:hypothetical protein LX36DRAFT_256017 [Colletotrichum falcatum]
MVMRREHGWYMSLTPRHAMPCHAMPCHASHASLSPSCPGSSLASPIAASLPDAAREFGTLPDSLVRYGTPRRRLKLRFHCPPPPCPSRYRPLGHLARHRRTFLCEVLRGSTADVHRGQAAAASSSSSRGTNTRGAAACRVRNDACKSHARHATPCHATPRHGADQIHQYVSVLRTYMFVRICM